MEKLLIIEDSRVMQAQLQDSLEGKYQLVFRDDGPPGIEAAGDESPDLILLDIYLPRMDGYDVCQALKTNDRTREIPVIFLTSLEAEHEKIRGFEAGADDYIVKPFYPGELLARIKLHLSSRREKRLAVELERLKLLRELAIALNHELNNPLTTVLGHLHLAARELQPGNDGVGERLGEIKKELEKIRHIMTRLASASRAEKTGYVMSEEMLDLAKT